MAPRQIPVFLLKVNMERLSSWLRNLGLAEYTQRFAENGIDFSVLPDLTEQDLKDIGVLLGHRRKLLRAIAELDSVPRGRIHASAFGERAILETHCRGHWRTAAPHHHVL